MPASENRISFGVCCLEYDEELLHPRSRDNFIYSRVTPKAPKRRAAGGKFAHSELSWKAVTNPGILMHARIAQSDDRHGSGRPQKAAKAPMAVHHKK